MLSFKKGDKIKYVGNKLGKPQTSAYMGKTGVVTTDVKEGDSFVFIRFDNGKSDELRTCNIRKRSQGFITYRELSAIIKANK